ncbi:unnamed protein product [Cuscuta campestris]|uniref:TF-B3 domain-containing protein n=1 Tax=Cuscuta campestris TaxID=132261 RepID=A0A484K8A0_9ASTE|nr:unnamed protein product [Cuscuta campestris]
MNNNMGQSKPAFFKVLIGDDFATHLRLPPYFIYKFGKLLPECPVLTVECGGGEASWRVKLGEVAAEGRCFADGWPEFVRDLGLGRHDFLVFWLESPSKFLVEVFNEDGTAKEFDCLQGKVSPRKEDACELDVVPPSSTDVIKGKTLSFSAKFKCSNRYRAPIPANFMRETGIKSKWGMVKDTTGREWPMRINGDRSKELGKGWSDFTTQNRLLPGDTCTFTYNYVENEGDNTSSGWLLRVAVQRRGSL